MAVLQQISIMLAGPRSAASSWVGKEGSVCNRLHPSVVSCCSLSHCTETNQQPQQQLWKWKMKWKTQCMLCTSLTPCFERSRNAALFLEKKRWKRWAPMREKFLPSVRSWRITTTNGSGLICLSSSNKLVTYVLNIGKNSQISLTELFFFLSWNKFYISLIRIRVLWNLFITIQSYHCLHLC